MQLPTLKGVLINVSNKCEIDNQSFNQKPFVKTK